MSQVKEQNLANHTRLDPMFHGFLFVGALFFLGAAIYQLIQDPNWWNAGRVFGVIWLMVLMFKMRLYALKLQDRVIRLEERVRLAQLAPDSLRGRIGELSERQLIALRFASDAELPGLAQKALADKLESKQIKQSIQHWRADYWRV